MSDTEEPIGDPEVPSPASAPEASIQDAPAATADSDVQPETSFPVVGIGASAGGLAAFEAFFSAMPSDPASGMAVVLVQHLAPDHKSILTELLQRHTRMQVYEVEDGMEVKPDCAYIIPPNRDMALLNGTLQLLEPASRRGLRQPIDFFFRSLAQDQRERAICIVLSGTGSDGTQGLRAVKGEGGMVMAQDPDSADYDGMPRSAIATGLVDYVLPPADMPAQLVAYVAHAFGTQSRPVSAPVPQIHDTLRSICGLLRTQTGHDFSQYKETTIVRRVERRMAIHQTDRPDDYLRLIQQDPAEVDALFRDLLIGVTNFFRDPEAFEVLRTQVIPGLFAGKSEGEAVRVWVCGCSSGEEAYSIAILIQEHLETLERSFKVQVFATDVDRRAIEHARNGVFPLSIAADVPSARLARFFTHDTTGGVYRVHKNIRDLLVFSEQDVIKDPPFSRMDLISCRNLLIYLNGELQRRLIPLFHYALNPGGALFLGSSETVGGFGSLFGPLDRKSKVYLRRKDISGAPRPTLGDFVPSLSEAAARHRQLRELDRGEGKVDLRELTEQALLQHYAQSGVLVNGRGEILHIYGRTGKYLEPAPGDAGVNILAMAREGLRRELTTALHKAVAHKEPVRCRGLRVRTNGDSIFVNLTVQRLEADPGEDVLSDMFLVLLEEALPDSPEMLEQSAGSGPAPPADVDARIAALEQELRAKEEYLQTTLEEMEASGEELKSANEEMQSVNEELQSTNEELETSKEELQSVNEELATVNAELQVKVSDLSRMYNDMNNLMAGTGVAILFVDHDLRISRFTPATTQLINLIQADVGRPVAHIVSNLVGYDRLVEDVRAVLDSLVQREAEVQTKAGAWYLMRIRPYRTLENVIEGAVITFIDITDRRRAQDALRDSEEKYRLLFETTSQGVAYWDREGRIIDANPAAERILGLRLDQLRGRECTDPGWKALHEDGTDFPAGAHPAMLALKTGKPVLGVIMGVRPSHEAGLRWVRIDSIPRLKPGEQTPYQVYSTFDDITGEMAGRNDPDC
jgi:two-component system CheB/CheR fusion protein